MINVKLIGHKYEHDLYELIRVFYPEESIYFIPENSPLLADKYLISELDEETGAIDTQYYVDKELTESHQWNLSDFLCKKRLTNPESKAVKASVYQVLSNATQIRLPWGILTGVRPVKIAHQLLDEDGDEKKALKCLVKSFAIAQDKADMILSIAKRQIEKLDLVEQGGYSLYVNIPFCPSICKYCAFPTAKLSRYKDQVPMYMDRLREEVMQTAELMEGQRLNTVYIGGGTPSSIPTAELERLIETVKAELQADQVLEFTVECGRADTISTPLLRMLKEQGVDRISINPQSMKAESLELIGREQTREQVLDAFNLAKRVGIPVINMDLILGLPGENLEDVEATLREIAKLDPENLTVHTLALKKGSKLRSKKSHASPEEAVEVERMIDETLRFSKKHGYHPYYLYRQKNMLGNFENIGYAKPGAECIYNILSMEECETIVGIGMGAISKFYFPEENRIERVANFRSVEEYLNRFHEQHRKKRATLKLED